MAMWTRWSPLVALLAVPVAERGDAEPGEVNQGTSRGPASAAP